MPPRDAKRPAAHLPVCREDIERGLASLGIGVGDVVLCHSSLSAFGYVEGGADAVVDALLAQVGPKGTLVVPSYPVDGWMYDSLHTNPLFDMRSAPTRAGRIAETVRRRPNARRSVEPWGAVAAIGAQAPYITRDDESDDSCGLNSPWGKLVELNAQELMRVGLEALRHEPTLFLTEPGWRPTDEDQ